MQAVHLMIFASQEVYEFHKLIRKSWGLVPPAFFKEGFLSIL